MYFYLVILACAFGSAWSAATTCKAQIAAYRQCTDKIRTERAREAMMALDAIQPQIEKCLTSSGCKVPGGEHAKNSTKQQCRQDIQAALKAQVLACVRKSDPGFDFPHEEESPENMKKDINKKDFLKACGGSKNKTKDVDACLKKVYLNKRSRRNNKNNVSTIIVKRRMNAKPRWVLVVPNSRHWKKLYANVIKMRDSQRMSNRLELRLLRAAKIRRKALKKARENIITKEPNVHVRMSSKKKIGAPRDTMLGKLVTRKNPTLVVKRRGVNKMIFFSNQGFYNFLQHGDALHWYFYW